VIAEVRKVVVVAVGSAVFVFDSAASFAEVILGSKVDYFSRVTLVHLRFLESERTLLIAGSVLEFVLVSAPGLTDVGEFLEVILVPLKPFDSEIAPVVVAGLEIDSAVLFVADVLDLSAVFEL
jgi:hypothetical protein